MNRIFFLPLFLCVLFECGVLLRHYRAAAWWRILVLLAGTAGGFFLLRPLLGEAQTVILLLTLLFFAACGRRITIQKSYEASASAYQNKLLKQQVAEVQNVYMTMRGWRHDYHNHLQSLKAYLKLGQVAAAEKYLNELETDLTNVDQLVETGNVNLDAILNSKLSLAEKQGISINYKAAVPPKLTISDIDLCVVIGNLIDNAVEACEKIDPASGNRFLRLYIGSLKGQLYISAVNATTELVRRMDDEYITTKRGNHGHGLKRINLIVEKYGGYISRKNEPGVFATEILLPL